MNFSKKILVSLRTVKSTVVKHPQNRFYIVDGNCVQRCKSGTIHEIMEGEISKISKDIGKLEDGLRHTEKELRSLEAQAMEH